MSLPPILPMAYPPDTSKNPNRLLRTIYFEANKAVPVISSTPIASAGHTSSSLTSSGGTFTGTLEGTEFIRNSVSQPSGKQLLAQENAPYVGPNSVIRTNSSTISEDVVIPQNTNGMSAGPISISSNVTITINGTWSIIWVH